MKLTETPLSRCFPHTFQGFTACGVLQEELSSSHPPLPEESLAVLFSLQLAVGFVFVAGQGWELQLRAARRCSLVSNVGVWCSGLLILCTLTHFVSLTQTLTRANHLRAP